MPRRRLPAYCLHKGSGQAYLTVNGRRVYLGTHGSPDSQRRYSEALAEWQQRSGETPSEVSVGQLTLLYSQHCQGHYLKNRTPTSKLHSVRSALRRLNQRFRDLAADEFAPRRLKSVRDLMISEGLYLGTINDYCSIIRQAFRWHRVKKLSRRSS